MKRVIHISIFSLFIVAVFGLMGFIYLENAKDHVGSIHVRIIRETDMGFLSKDNILDLIHDSDSISSMQIKEISPGDIESQIMSSPFAEKADAFINIDKNLIINVEEKQPSLRIFTRNGSSFYLDDHGQPFPVNEDYASLVTVASGYIHIEIHQQTGLPLADEHAELMSNLFLLVSKIRQNDFLHAQISQIYLNSKGEFDLIPEVGDHIIQLGTLDHLDDKLKKLELWYKKSFVSEGWEKYSVINLMYHDQIVCTRKNQ